MADREELAMLVYAETTRQALVPNGGFFWELYDWAQDRYRLVADRIIASMWLAEHDRQVWNEGFSAAEERHAIPSDQRLDHDDRADWLAEHGRQERDAERDRVLGIMLNTPRGDSMTEWLESVARQASNVVQPGGE